MDVTESPVERPKKTKKDTISAKKHHTQKTQLIVNMQNGENICTTHAEGSKHNFIIYQDSIGGLISEGILFLGDSGYQGILKLHKNSEIPKKKPRNGTLSVEEKRENCRISRERVFVENIIAKFKVFKILANKYRNRRKRYELRASLICGIINYEIKNRN